MVLTVPMGKAITVSERKEDYTASWALNGGEKHSGSVWTGSLTASAGASLSFENNLSQDVPTGVTLSALPFWLLLVLGAGLTAIPVRGKKREDA